MFFKLTAKNAYRDLVKNMKIIASSKNLNDYEKFSAYQSLLSLLKPRLQESERNLNMQTAFSKKCDNWNIIHSYSNRKVTNIKNPWLAIKRELQNSLQKTDKIAVQEIEISIGWFDTNKYLEYWIV